MEPVYKEAFIKVEHQSEAKSHVLAEIQEHSFDYVKSLSTQYKIEFNDTSRCLTAAVYV
jgi:hypothetical protein